MGRSVEAIIEQREKEREAAERAADTRYAYDPPLKSDMAMQEQELRREKDREKKQADLKPLRELIFHILDALPPEAIADYVGEKMELYSHDEWMDMMAGASEARRG